MKIFKAADKSCHAGTKRQCDVIYPLGEFMADKVCTEV